MARLVSIGHHKKRQFPSSVDMVVKGNGLDYEDIWSKNEGLLIFSPRECRRLLKFYSLEAVGGKWCDYRIDRGESWAHFYLLGKGESTLSIGKHKIGKHYDFFLYESGQLVKKFDNLDAVLNYYVSHYKNKKADQKTKNS